MNTIINELKENFRRGNIAIQLIYINVGVFIVSTLATVILQLFNINISAFFQWLELPAWPQRFLTQPWSILSYMFLHADVWHILFNMYSLFIFGCVLEHVWGGKKFLLFYLVTGIGAALIHSGVMYLEAISLQNSLEAGNIATNIKSNIRELEGALNKVIAFAKINKKELTLDIAKEALKERY